MKLRYLKNTVSLTLDAETCTGCGMCIDVCPHGVFELDGRKAVIIDRDACMECGACKKNCPAGAIEVGSGVGCAAAVINGIIRGTTPDCGCSGSSSSGCCS